MGYTPKGIVDYIIENGLEADVLAQMQIHKGGYSIGEIADKKFLLRDSGCKFMSKSYEINIKIEDEDIITAVHNGLYISAFISRKDESYNVHFLVHQYPESMKTRFEDEIATEVIRYMLLHTVVALRLDTPQKVRDYGNVSR